MNEEVINTLLEKYRPQNRAERERALREILQELVLVGLWRAKFFEKAAFYGGTALRILYGLDRFSEDLDFTLKDPIENFDWNHYHLPIVEELRAYGFQVSLTKKEKRKSSTIQSAFLKTNTIESLIKVGTDQTLLRGLHPEASIKIRVEIDTDPVLGLHYETVMMEEPVAVPISAVIKEDLFAGKMHAALYRAWKNRVKGRDWWDVIWFIRKKIPINLEYVASCMHANKTLKKDEKLTLEALKSLAVERVQNIDIASLKADVRPFLRDPSFIDPWSVDFFKTWIEKIQ